MHRNKKGRARPQRARIRAHDSVRARERNYSSSEYISRLESARGFIAAPAITARYLCHIAHKNRPPAKWILARGEGRKGGERHTVDERGIPAEVRNQGGTERERKENWEGELHTSPV